MADFYVSRSGNDLWSGTIPEPNADESDGPFAGLERARDAVRESLRGGEGGRDGGKTRRNGGTNSATATDSRFRPPESATGENDIVVQIRGGIYELERTLSFGPEDSAGDDRRVVYEAYPGECPVLSGGRPIGPWRRLQETPIGLLPEAVDHVWVADVAPGALNREPCDEADGEGVSPFFTLYDGERLLPRARSAGFVPRVEVAAEGEDDSALADKRTIRFPDGAMRAWEHPDQVELCIIPKYPWFYDIVPLESVDETAQTARTAYPTAYPMEPVRIHTRSGKPTAWVENCLEALTEPGEWVLDAGGGLLYLWPLDDEPSECLRAPGLRELIRIARDEGAGSPVRGIVFRGLSFRHGDRLPVAADRRYGYGMYDASNALVRLTGAEECSIESCRFSCSGDTGVRLDFHCRGNRVVGSRFEELGGCAVMVCGYRDPTEPDASGENEIADNEIHRCGLIFLSASGIYIHATDRNHVHHNRVSELPHNGLMLCGTGAPPAETLRTLGIEPPADDADPVEAYRRALPHIRGRDNVVEYNEVFDVMRELGDGNGMYINGAGGGNIVRRNFFHDITGFGCQSALRTDDFQSGTRMVENLIWRCVGGGITLKQVNDIENNIVAMLLPKTLPDGTQQPPDAYILLRRGPSAGSKIRRNILYHVGGVQQVYCEGRIKRWPLAFAKDCDTDYNLYWCTDDPEATRSALEGRRKEGIDEHSVAADPLFVDPSAGDFRLSLDSPAHELGFEEFVSEGFGPRARG